MKILLTICIGVCLLACGSPSGNNSSGYPTPHQTNPTPAPGPTPPPQPDYIGTLIDLSTFNGDLSDQINQAAVQYDGQEVTFQAKSGNFGSPWELKENQHLYLPAGRYTSSVNRPDGIHFYLASNASVYGDGIDKTIIQESSAGGRNNRMFGPTGFKGEPAFSGYNEKINLHDFTIEGQPSQVFFDNGPTTIQLGNCTDCHAVRIKLKDTHAYGIYIGGFHAQGYIARDSSVEYCEFDHVIAQNTGALNGINIKIVHNKFWNLGKLSTDPLSNAVDVEPNVEDEVTQNIVVCDNEAKGGGNGYWNGVIVQIGGGQRIKGGEICRNNISGPGLLNAYMIAGTDDINFHDNTGQQAMQSGAYLNGNIRLAMSKNKLVNVAPGGIFAVRVENTIDSLFTNNSITKTSPGNDDRFVEIGNSTRNVYSGNKRGSVVLLSGSVEKDHL